MLRTLKRWLLSAIAAGAGSAIPGQTLYWTSSPGNLVPPGHTISRASTGTYFDSAGLLQTAAIDEVRGTYRYNGSAWVFDGTIEEAAATNLCLQSENFSTTWTPSNGTITANSTTAPDGNTTADSLVATGAGSAVTQSFVKAASAIQYTTSVFVKPSSKSWIVVILYDNVANGNRYWFNLSGDGALGSTNVAGTGFTGISASISVAANGFYRVSLTGTSNTAAALAVQVAPADGDLAFSSATSGTQIILWGAQLETGSAATSYTPTTTVAVTRSADVLTEPTSGLLVNAQGFAAIKGRTIQGDAAAGAFLSSFAGGADAVPIYTVGGSLTVFDGVGHRGGAPSTLTAGTVFSAATTWAGTTYNVAWNGTVGTPVTAGTGMNLTANLRIGDHVSGSSQPISMVLQSLRYGVLGVDDRALGAITKP